MYYVKAVTIEISGKLVRDQEQSLAPALTYSVK